ncbi:MAG: TnsA endonuclease N-terminal domain-containing protein [Euryarchaeota archaeon]|nr:TnsA endonuclease N-terminal domain-containing protein [Euryarchaeota archaeon]MCG2734815.1 TnsA endonuclease N-terminal domain-containing protein [Candidatus Methanoperedenaceae archaeon]
MPTSEHGNFENPKKSAYSIEFYDSSWEKEYMEKLENNSEIKKWTKNHGIQIPYFDDDGKFHTFKPDFLVERIDGIIEIHEIKGTHFLKNPITKKKFDAGDKYSKARKMNFKIISKHQ